MAQFARPDQDVADGAWTPVGGPSDLFDCVDESSPNDSDYMEDVANNTTAELGLTSVSDPGVGTGHIIRFRMQGNGGAGPERCNVQLFEGATLRADTGSQTSRGAWDTKVYTLTEAEADSIGAYTDLRFKVISSNLAGGETMWVSWAEFEVPDVAAGGGLPERGTLRGILRGVGRGAN